MRTVALLSFVCLYVGAAWIDDPKLRKIAENRVKFTESKPIGNTTVPRYSVNLDLDPADRWTAIASLPFYQKNAPAIVQYLKDQVPAWLLPIMETIAGDIEPYFGKEFGGEMVALAKTLKLKVGDVVAMNMIMQLESIGLNCSNWNNTGPTVKDDPGCKDVDPTQKWCYCKAAASVSSDPIVSIREFKQRTGRAPGPGMCTSVVAQDPHGNIFHGRNLDWNVPEALRAFIVDVDYMRANKTVFTGTTAIGFVGVLNGVKRGAFSASIDAREKGGKIGFNLLQMLLKKSKTPAQHLRAVLASESATDFSSALTGLSSSPLIDQIYYIVGGAAPGQGAVIARSRDKAVDVWHMNATATPDGWFLLETNYDRTNPVPVADDRRTPGRAHMRALGQSGIGERGNGLYSVMKMWPTFNHHTDYSAIMSCSERSYMYNSTVWYDGQN